MDAQLVTGQEIIDAAMDVGPLIFRDRGKVAEFFHLDVCLF